MYKIFPYINIIPIKNNECPAGFLTSFLNFFFRGLKVIQESQENL